MLISMRRSHPRTTAALIIALSVLAASTTSRSHGAAPQSSSAAASSVAATPTAPAPASGVPNGAISRLPAAAGGAPTEKAGLPDGVAPTPVPGIVEVRRGADIVYMSRDGKYVFTGELYEVAHHVNLTEARRRELRRSLIDAVPESQMLVFAPAQPKYSVTVFTDVDCVYCRAFHRQIDAYLKRGVRVRYVFFPRTGPNTESWFKAEQVWCSPDRRAALTRAKLGQPLSAKRCADTPVGRDYALGEAIGLEGTPGIVAANGAMLGGYLSPDELVQALKESSQD
jgi:thiol:disulfide interchange protein DsbC